MSQILSASTTVTLHELATFRIELDLSPAAFQDITGVNPHRLRRGRLRGPVAISATAAAEMLRCRKLYRLALDLCQERDSALDWLYSPSPALGGVSPIDLAVSDSGVRKVEGLLRAIQLAAGQPTQPAPQQPIDTELTKADTAAKPSAPQPPTDPEPAPTSRFRIAEGLRAARAAVPGLTKAEIARRMQQAGFDKFQTSTASRYEYGYADATWQEIVVLAGILGVTTGQLRAGK